MLRSLWLLVVLALFVVPRGAFGDDLEDGLPADPEARLMILIAHDEACAAGDEAACAIVGREAPATKVTLPPWL